MRQYLSRKADQLSGLPRPLSISSGASARSIGHSSVGLFGIGVPVRQKTLVAYSARPPILSHSVP